MSPKILDDAVEIPTTTTTTTKSGGFRSFWKHEKNASSASSGKGSPSAGESDVPNGKAKDGKSNRVGRLLKGESWASVSTTDQPGGAAESASGGKRRQQIYLAQKRHRNRRAEYIKNLEDEVAKLRSMDSTVRDEVSSLVTQNRMMKELLASHSINAQLDTMNLAAPSSAIDRDVAMSDYALVDIRFDADIGHERAFLDVAASDDTAWSSGTASATPEAKTQAQAKGDSWAAADFILALEWPCRGHMHHSGINPNVVPHIECDMGKFTGHTLTATAAVFESALPPGKRPRTQTAQNASAPDGGGGAGQNKWLLPHSEIDKLVILSEDLPLEDEEMTPAQAYAAVKKNVSSDEDLKSMLKLLKIPLGAIAQCRGYGASLPVNQFWQHLETALTSLKA